MENTTKKFRRHGARGISIRGMDYTIAGITLIISVLLLFATFRANNGYNELREETERYIQWERDANMLQEGSDYLTEEVRCFVETGDRQYLDNYFYEANVTRRRDRALDELRARFGGTSTYLALENAMAQSVSLMDKEYYAMRLIIEARDYAVEEYPEEIQRVELSSSDAALRPEEKETVARSLVYGQGYRTQKTLIINHVQSCLNALSVVVDREQNETSESLHRLLLTQRVLIIVLIIVTVVMMLTTLLLVISPLLRAVVYIRAEQPIPITGSNEFQFLAKTYNLMYEASREKKEQLAFQATHDALTGVYNRSGYDFLMANVDLSTSALMVLDIDKFKDFNDKYGHEVGDRVLRKVADTIRESFRTQDYICRIGGDEFAVILVHAGRTTAELIRRKISNVNAVLQDPGEGLPPISVSCGVAYGAEYSDEKTIFNAADAALYHIKFAGGCGCEVSE